MIRYVVDLDILFQGDNKNKNKTQYERFGKTNSIGVQYCVPRKKRKERHKISIYLLTKG